MIGVRRAAREPRRGGSAAGTGGRTRKVDRKPSSARDERRSRSAASSTAASPPSAAVRPGPSPTRASGNGRRPGRSRTGHAGRGQQISERRGPARGATGRGRPRERGVTRVWPTEPARRSAGRGTVEAHTAPRSRRGVRSTAGSARGSATRSPYVVGSGERAPSTSGQRRPAADSGSSAARSRHRGASAGPVGSPASAVAARATRPDKVAPSGSGSWSAGPEPGRGSSTSTTRGRCRTSGVAPDVVVVGVDRLVDRAVDDAARRRRR